MPAITLNTGIYLDTEAGELFFSTDLDVEYDYEPGQPEILHPADLAQEGFPENFTVTAVKLFNHDIIDNLDSTDIEAIETYVKEDQPEPDDPDA